MARHSKRVSSSILEPIEENLEDIYGVILIAAALFLVVSIFSQATGVIGNYTNLALQYLVGIGRYLVPLALVVWGMSFLLKREQFSAFSTGLGLAICFISFIALAELSSKDPRFWLIATKSYGGIIGGALGYLLRFLVGKIGAYIILGALMIVGAIIILNISLIDLFIKLKGEVQQLIEKIRSGQFILLKRKDKPKEDEPAEKDKEEIYEPTQIQAEEIEEQEETPLIERVAKRAAAVGKPTQLKMKVEAVASEEDYRLPPLELLKTTSPLSSSRTKKSVSENVKILEHTLHNFEVDASVIRVTKGPTVTQYEIQLASGVKVNSLLSLADDIALALATPDVRILTPVPGKSVVGIEVPNKYKELVTLGDILNTEKAKQAKESLTIAIGKDISGHPVLADLGDMPHLLIAGATGSGKSVSINSIITSMLMRVKPGQLKMILVDPKRIELNLFNHIPHLITPVVTDIKKAATVLSWAVREMEDRFQQLSQVGAKNIDSYNAILSSKKGKEYPDLDILPYIVIVIDELADLMMVAPAEVENAVCRLAQLARAVGIHLVIATQRPSVDVITGLIKANITSRIAFAVSSQTDSRVVLDRGGADKLVGKGDMLFLRPGASRPRRIQGAFVTEPEVELVTSFVRKQMKPEYRPEVLEDAKSKFGTSGFHDELYDNAMELVVTTQQASISMLQRRLKVGYSRAARLIDMLEEKGVVGGFEGSKPRAVLMTLEDMEKTKKMAEVHE